VLAFFLYLLTFTFAFFEVTWVAKDGKIHCNFLTFAYQFVFGITF